MEPSTDNALLALSLYPAVYPTAVRKRNPTKTLPFIEHQL